MVDMEKTVISSPIHGGFWGNRLVTLETNIHLWNLAFIFGRLASALPHKYYNIPIKKYSGVLSPSPAPHTYIHIDSIIRVNKLDLITIPDS